MCRSHSVEWDQTEFQRLIHGAARGQKAELSALWRAHHGPLVGWLRAVEPAAADDLASDTWVDALRSIKKFEGDEPQFRSWLFTIARRRLIDFRRRQMRRPDQCVLMVPEIRGHEMSDVFEERDTSMRALEVMSGALLPDQYEVVLLRVVGGLSAQDVATLLGKSPEAVRATQHRALIRLAKSTVPADFVVELRA